MDTATQSGPANGSRSDSAEAGVIAVAGPGAEAFLQAQLSNDVEGLGTDDSRLATWCDAKGRVLAVLRVLRRDEDFLLILPRVLVSPVLQRLRRFVLRAHVELRDAGGELAIRGMFGEPEPVHGLPPNTVARDGARQYLTLPGPQSRCLVIAPPNEAPEAANATAWRRVEILAGLPQIYPETQGRFVPQMLNLHWLGGIDFHKGCYPGQEIVARLEYRGKLARRLFRGVLDAVETPPPGTPVTDAEGAVRGEVVEAVPGPEGQDLLAVLRVDAADESLRIDGAELTLGPLPYLSDPDIP
jgi:hypothetical protein